MKPEKIGLPGSVAIICLIYVVALAAAPETGLSAHANPTRADPTGPVEYQTALVVGGGAASLSDMTGGIQPSNPMAHPLSSMTIRACPSTLGAEMYFELMQAHHRMPNRPLARPGVHSPPWRGGRLTVF